VSPWLWVGLGCGGLCLCTVPLAAILFPVFSQAKVAAQRTQCMSNLKQLGLATLMYASDYDETLPAASAWMDATKQYGTTPTNSKCPLVNDGHGYAMNDALSKKKIAKIAKPESVILLFETADLGDNAHGKPPALGTPAPRHGSRTISYVNGAVRSIRDGRRR
jgi:hypothetical protein